MHCSAKDCKVEPFSGNVFVFDLVWHLPILLSDYQYSQLSVDFFNEHQLDLECSRVLWWHWNKHPDIDDSTAEPCVHFVDVNDGCNAQLVPAVAPEQRRLNTERHFGTLSKVFNYVAVGREDSGSR